MQEKELKGHHERTRKRNFVITEIYCSGILQCIDFIRSAPCCWRDGQKITGIEPCGRALKIQFSVILEILTHQFADVQRILNITNSIKLHLIKTTHRIFILFAACSVPFPFCHVPHLARSFLGKLTIKIRYKHYSLERIIRQRSPYISGSKGKHKIYQVEHIIAGRTRRIDTLIFRSQPGSWPGRGRSFRRSTLARFPRYPSLPIHA